MQSSRRIILEIAFPPYLPYEFEDEKALVRIILILIFQKFSPDFSETIHYRNFQNSALALCSKVS